jgi:type II secretory pathway pseudopilin PulG
MTLGLPKQVRSTVSKGAFTLTEVLVYLALLAALSLLVFGFAARTYRFMLERTRVHQVLVRMAAIAELVRRDVAVASPWLVDWDAAHATFKQLTMTADGEPFEEWVGYEVTEKGLNRRAGTYIPASGAWTESTGALVNAYVTSIQMRPVIGQQAGAFPEAATAAAATMGAATTAAATAGSTTQGLISAVTVLMKFMVAEKEKEYAITVALRNRVLG